MDQLLAEFLRRTDREWEQCKSVTGSVVYVGHPRQLRLMEDLFNNWVRVREALAERKQ